MPAPRWLSVGRVSKPFGVRGEMHLTLHTDFPEQLTRRPVYVGDERRQLQITAVRVQKEQAIIRIEGFTTVEAAEALRGKELFITAETAAPLPEGRFYIHQIIGLQVYTSAGDHYGIVRDVLSRPANDVYVVEHDGRETLIPAIKDVVKEINVAEGRLVIELIEGLE